MTGKPRISTQVRIPPEVHERLQQMAEANHRSVNSEIIVALERHTSIVQPKRDWLVVHGKTSL